MLTSVIFFIFHFTGVNQFLKHSSSYLHKLVYASNTKNQVFRVDLNKHFKRSQILILSHNIHINPFLILRRFALRVANLLYNNLKNFVCDIIYKYILNNMYLSFFLLCYDSFMYTIHFDTYL